MRLIDADVLIAFERLDAQINDHDANDVLLMVKSAPTIDTATVVHGHWFLRGGRFRCSRCDARALLEDVGGTGGFSHEYEQVKSKICPSCGARMDAEEAHDDEPI